MSRRISTRRTSVVRTARGRSGLVPNPPIAAACKRGSAMCLSPLAAQLGRASSTAKRTEMAVPAVRDPHCEHIRRRGGTFVTGRDGGGGLIDLHQAAVAVDDRFGGRRLTADLLNQQGDVSESLKSS